MALSNYLGTESQLRFRKVPMSSATLHYIYDPLCGWCYAAAPLVEAASQLVPIQFHGGGMMTGTRRQKITPAWRDYVRPQDRQIGRATGQHFGEAYLDGLLEDQSAVLDSGPPTAAILAAQGLNGAGLKMLAQLHKAHCVQDCALQKRRCWFKSRMLSIWMEHHS